MDEGKPLGRPTLFKDEYSQSLLDYFNVKPYEKRDGREVPTDFPSLAGFAIKIGVHRDTLHEWANAKDADGSIKYPDFSDAYKRAKDFQENYLLINGNKGLINPAFSIFTAKNVIGYRDKQPGEEDKTITHKIENLSDDELDKKIKTLTGDTDG